MVQKCGCLDMAELTKKLYIKKGTTQQTAKLYSTTAEAGTAYAHLIADGVQAYLPLGEQNDGRATLGRVKETSGHEFAILTSGKPPYHKDSYTSPGTHTWTCPAGVTTASVTVAGGGGGSGTRYIFAGGKLTHPGGSGQLITTTVDVTPHTAYSITVGAGGHYATTSSNTPARAGDGGPSSFGSISARGGGGATTNEKGTSYGSGASGGSGEKANGQTGWVYVEYGGDI